MVNNRSCQATMIKMREIVILGGGVTFEWGEYPNSEARMRETWQAGAGLSEESKRALGQCFDHYDKSGDGIIDIDELPEALKFAGIYTTREGAAELAHLFDTNKDGKLQIKEMVNNWELLSQHSVNGEELLDAFKKIDVKRDGYIRVPELKVLLTKAGEKWELNEAEQCLQTLMKYDRNGDGKFDYSEFVQMYTENAYPFKKPEYVERKDITQDYELVKADGENCGVDAAKPSESAQESEGKGKEEEETGEAKVQSEKPEGS